MGNKVEIVIAVDSATGQAHIKGTTRDLEEMGRRGKTSLDGLTRAATALAGAFSAWQVATWTKDTILLADKYQTLDARLKLVTKSSAELADTQTMLFAQSQAAGVGYANTIELHTRLARSTEDLNISQDRLVNITGLINKSMIASGASTTEANAALIQFSQGLASGALRGDELRSVMEQTPRLAKAIADGLGVSIGELRKLGEDGALTADKVLAAIEKSGDGIMSEFDQLPVTVSRAMAEVGNSFGGLVSRFNEASGATSLLADRLENVSHLLDIISGRAGHVTVAGLEHDVKRRIGEVQKEMADAAGRLDSPYELGVFKEGAKKQIQDLAAELVSLNEELDYLRQPTDDPVKPLSDGSVRGVKTLKELTATWKDYQAAMASTLSGEAAEIDKLTKSYDAKREAVEEQYKGQATSQKELSDLAALDAAEQRDLAELRKKFAEDRKREADKEFKDDEDRLKHQLDMLEDYSRARKKREEDAIKKGTEAWKDYQSNLEAVTTGAMTEHERKVYDIEKSCAVLEERLVSLVEAGRLSFDEADQWQAKFKARADAELAALYESEQKHKKTSDKVAKLWEHAGERMTDTLADWLATGENGLAGFEKSFERMVVQMVATWIMGQDQMTSAQSAQLGGNLAMAGTMLGGTTSYAKYASAGLGVVTELFNPGAYGAALGTAKTGLEIGLAKYGFDGAADSLHLMSTNAFGASTAGIGTFVTSLLSGQDFTHAAVSGAGSAAGAYIGSMIMPGIGTIVGSMLGSQLGGLLGGGDAPSFTLDELSSFIDKSYSRYNGFTTTSKGAEADGTRPTRTYLDTIASLQSKFSDQVKGVADGLTGAVRDQFLRAVEAQDFSVMADGRWEDQQKGITEVATAYAEKLDAAMGKAIKAVLPSIAKTLTKDNKVYSYLAADLQKNIQAQIDSANFSAADLSTMQQFFGAIDQAMAPISEILATHGLSDYERSLRGINAQYDNYSAKLKAAGVDLAKYTSLEKARALLIGDLKAELQKEQAQAKSPIADIIATHGMTEFEKSLWGINQQFADYAEQLKAAGVDLAKYTDLEKAKRIAIEQASESQRKSLAEYQKELLTSAASPFGIKAEYDLLRSDLTTYAKQSKSGDPEAMEKLQRAAGEFLSLSKQVNGTASGYASDFAFIQSLIGGALAASAKGLTYGHTGGRITNIRNDEGFLTVQPEEHILTESEAANVRGIIASLKGATASNGDTKALRAEVQALTAATKAIALHVHTLLKVHQRWDINGLPVADLVTQ